MTSALSVAYRLENEVLQQKSHRWIQQLRICSKWWRAWGQFWIPWYQPCWWDAFGPAFIWYKMLSCGHCHHCPVSPSTAKKLVSGTKCPFLPFARGISLARGVFFSSFFLNIFSFPWLVSGNCPASSSQHPGKITSNQNSCDRCSLSKARYYSVSLGLKISKYVYFVFLKNTIVSSIY